MRSKSTIEDENSQLAEELDDCAAAFEHEQMDATTVLLGRHCPKHTGTQSVPDWNLERVMGIERSQESIRKPLI